MWVLQNDATKGIFYVLNVGNRRRAEATSSRRTDPGAIRSARRVLPLQWAAFDVLGVLEEAAWKSIGEKELRTKPRDKGVGPPCVNVSSSRALPLPSFIISTTVASVFTVRQ